MDEVVRNPDQLTLKGILVELWWTFLKITILTMRIFFGLMCATSLVIAYWLFGDNLDIFSIFAVLNIVSFLTVSIYTNYAGAFSFSFFSLSIIMINFTFFGYFLSIPSAAFQAKHIKGTCQCAPHLDHFDESKKYFFTPHRI